MELSDQSCTVAGAQGIGEINRERLGDMLRHANYERPATRLTRTSSASTKSPTPSRSSRTRSARTSVDG